MPGTLRLKAGHVQPIWAGHPWVYAQAVERPEGGPMRGEAVEVVDPRGNFLGAGLYSPGSAIVTRILTRRPGVAINAAFLRDAIEQAAAARIALGLGGDDDTGYRVIHSEGDTLGGLIVDKLGDTLVVQFLTAGMHAQEAAILSSLKAIFKPKCIVDRTPERFAKLEGVPPLRGRIYGEGPTDAPNDYRFTERGLSYRIPQELGQKTGYYFDQRPLRARIESLARGKRVLDAYGYVGSCALAAARGGATSVVSVDENALAGEVGAELARMNGLSVQYTCNDAKLALAEAKGKYDLVIVDPPRLAPSKKNRDAALQHYAKLASLGCSATQGGGLMVLCSCSSAVDLSMLTRALAVGAQKANVSATIVERLFQAPDHPVLASFPEGLYLKAIVSRITPKR
jgi:23S rRNA (cytosine1962-C5)-methyltransferase